MPIAVSDFALPYSLGRPTEVASAFASGYKPGTDNEEAEEEEEDDDDEKEEEDEFTGVSAAARTRAGNARTSSAFGAASIADAMQMATVCDSSRASGRRREKGGREMSPSPSAEKY